LCKNYQLITTTNRGIMIRILWLQAVKSAWSAYIDKIDCHTRPDRMHDVLDQKTGLDITLEEFGEMVFIEGFAAGEKYARHLMVGCENKKARLN
jgi:hypothetical protein